MTDACQHTRIINHPEPRVGGPVSVCRNCDKTWGEWVKVDDYANRNDPLTYLLLVTRDAAGVLLVAAPAGDG